jgi:transketolase
VREASIDTLTKLAAVDPRILLLTGDLGYTVVEPFVDKFPDRFFNVGVAEQNMIGLATGLAEAGFIPFCYSMTTFALLRPYEFIRNGPILHHLPVRIMGVGGGFEYGHAGATHHGLEDLAVLRTQPGITLIAPADYEQATAAIEQTWDLPGPIYYRLSKDKKTRIPELAGQFSLGRAQTIRQGADVLLVSLGNMVSEVMTAAQALATQGIESTVIVIASLNPAPIADLVSWLAQFSLALTVEAHYINGGIGSLVAEVVAERGLPCRLVRCGVRTSPEGIGGSQGFLNQMHGLSSEALVETVLRAIGDRV